MRITDSLVATARRVPERPFVIDSDGRQHGYREILQRAAHYAAELRRLGVQPGDRVGLAFPASADFVCAYVGILLCDGVAVPLDPRAPAPEFERALNAVAARGWVGVSGTASGRLEIAPRAEGASDPDLPVTDRAPGDALLLFTSGTTSTPKAVRLTHANLVHTAAAITLWAEVGSDERELITLPLTHLFGLAHLHVHWGLGNTVLFEDGLRDVPAVLRRLESERVTSFPATPAGLRLLLDRFPAEFSRAAATLRYLIVNSAPLDVPYVERLLEALPHVRCYMYYGLTEASRSTYIRYDAHRDKLATVGIATPGCSVCVGDPDAPLVGEPGEVLIRGPHVTPGYWNANLAAAANGARLEAGWLATGDIGVMDAEGFLTWVGRVSEQINVDGQKVAPAEVEAVLRGHPRVRDCAAVGAPHPLTGQVVVAYVVADGETDERLATEIRRHCVPHLAPYKIPRRVEFVSAIPRTEAGKVQRRRLLEPAARGTG